MVAYLYRARNDPGIRFEGWPSWRRCGSIRADSSQEGVHPGEKLRCTGALVRCTGTKLRGTGTKPDGPVQRSDVPVQSSVVPVQSSDVLVRWSDVTVQSFVGLVRSHLDRYN